MPKVRLSENQQAIIDYVKDLNMSLDEVKEVLEAENDVGGETVTFTENQVQAILANPSDYGLQ